jgi:hypothetical protein
MGFLGNFVAQAAATFVASIGYIIWSASTGTDAEKASRPNVAEWLEENGFVGNTGESATHELPEHWAKIRLIHVEELKNWNGFRIYQSDQGISYKDYFKWSKYFKSLKFQLSELIEVKEKIIELSGDNYVTYKEETLITPRSLFFRIKKVPLYQKMSSGTLEDTIITSDMGHIRRYELHIRCGWRKRKVRIFYSCPAKIKNREQIGLLNETLSSAPLEERNKLSYLEEYIHYTHPVLFISHKWRTQEHPDPHNEDFCKLRELSNCFIIYDYSSFPQERTSSRMDIAVVLRNMNNFVDNVVILKSDEYLTRGWCVYEYFLSSLKCSIVCDEIQHPAFVLLRNLVSTQTSSVSTFLPGGESTSARQENYISQNIINCSNEIMKLYRKARFSNMSIDKVDGKNDRDYVDSLLVNFLIAKLPSKREHIPYGNNWIYTKWTEEEIRRMFESEIGFDGAITLPININSTDVPSTIEEAVKAKYEIRKQSLWHRLIPGEFRGL